MEPGDYLIWEQELDAVFPCGDTGAASMPFHPPLRPASALVPHVEGTSYAVKPLPFWSCPTPP